MKIPQWTAIAVCMLLAGCVGVSAARPMRVDVEKIGSNSFEIFIEADVKAPIASVWGVMTDYEHHSEFLPYLVSSQIVYRNAEYKVVDQVGRFRMLFWTFTMRVKQKVREDRPSQLQFQAIDGDFTLLDGDWKLSPSGDGTHMACRFKVQPRRRVPGWAVKIAAKRYLAAMTEKIALRAESAK